MRNGSQSAPTAKVILVFLLRSGAHMPVPFATDREAFEIADIWQTFRKQRLLGKQEPAFVGGTGWGVALEDVQAVYCTEAPDRSKQERLLDAAIREAGEEWKYQ